MLPHAPRLHLETWQSGVAAQRVVVVPVPSTDPPRPAQQRAAQRQARRRRVYGQVRALAEAIDLAQDFAELVRRRQPERLDAWLARGATSALQALRRFAKGLGEDYAAVKAGVTLPWSMGPVEGHINRLKMLKRQMFGRARLDLLSRRFVLAV